MWKVWLGLGVFYMAFGLVMIWSASRHFDKKLSSRDKMMRLYNGGNGDDKSPPNGNLKRAK